MDELGLQFLRGDEGAMEALYDAFADRVHHYLVLKLGSRADADDVLQEVFVRLVRSRSRIVDAENVSAYIFTTARNEAIRWQQRNRDRPSPLFGQDLFVESASNRFEVAEFVTGALLLLSDAEREVIQLKFYSQLTFREIASVVGAPQGTVASRYRRAMMRLREHLDARSSVGLSTGQAHGEDDV